MDEAAPGCAGEVASPELEGLELCAPVASWFRRRFSEPTQPQRAAWPEIARGDDVLVAAPTGSGKTLAAFLLILDRLVRRALAGELEDRLETLYISPLRALSHDIQKNLEAPLREIREEAERLGSPIPPIRVEVRTGDTPPAARARMLRRPPHIVVTTPESFFLMITAPRSRALLEDVRDVVVDEIHALARDKRGSHLALSLARLDHLLERRPRRIGLSATQRPLELLARFLVGADRRRPSGEPDCTVVDCGHQRELDLAVHVPSVEDLCAVASHEQWDDLLSGLASLVEAHRTTLIFVNTRRLAERIAHRLGERMDEASVAAHHGSLSRERRLSVEARLREGSLRALVATASLELGIDIGSIDLVCQVGSPRSIAAFLQRVGRSGHALGKTPRGRLIPTTRDELVECAALVRAACAGRLDAVALPRAPLDILAQQIVAATADEDWSEDELLACFRRATGFEMLEDARFEAVLEMLAQGFETPGGRRAQYVHRDRLEGRVRGRRGARIAALTSGGAIPERGDYRVVLDPDETFVGTVDEDWAIESNAGDIFLLGTHSWRIRRVEAGQVRVVDAQGAPPTIPFWLGEAPARTSELGTEVSQLRSDAALWLRDGEDVAAARLREACRLCKHGARQIVHYVRAQVESLGLVPTHSDLVAERFFDDSGGMQLVVHSPLGGRINRGIGLALRKRFCRAFDQELQAAATDDGVVLSLGNPQTFPLDSLPRFLSPKTIDDVLEQAFLGSPLFAARWRWNATRSLAVLRSSGGRRVPFPIQRMRADDLLAASFPALAACQEHVEYPIEVPDHPLVRQTLHDCLNEAADVEGIRALLEALEAGEVRFHVFDTVEPSPFAHEIIGARPYAFLDDAPLEERRTRAVALRRVLPEHARDLAKLDPAAIKRVRDEAWPSVRSADEAHELLMDVVLLPPDDPFLQGPQLGELRAAGRLGTATIGPTLRVFAAERLAELRALHPDANVELARSLPAALGERCVPFEEALDAALRGQLALRGPVTAQVLVELVQRAGFEVEASLARLESRGLLLRGDFDPELSGEQFCDRGLLARIHRYTLSTLRSEIEPVSARVFLRFLTHWQNLTPETQALGESGLLGVIEKLAGFEAPASTWERHLLPARVQGYAPAALDALCLSGAVGWGRLSRPSSESIPSATRSMPLALFPRGEIAALLHALREPDEESQVPQLGRAAELVLERLEARGALFADELIAESGLAPSQLEQALRELIAGGFVHSDGFAPLRRLLGSPLAPRAPRRALAGGLVLPDGRWARLEARGDAPDELERAESLARQLLSRYGVVFRDLLGRERTGPGWRLLHRALRRLEARGEVRGGRFVAGFTGEQFALPEAVPRLRRERRPREAARELRVSACDPLNLAGVLTPGPRVPAVATRELVLEDGLPVAVIERGRRSALPTR